MFKLWVQINLQQKKKRKIWTGFSLLFWTWVNQRPNRFRRKHFFLSVTPLLQVCEAPVTGVNWGRIRPGQRKSKHLKCWAMWQNLCISLDVTSNSKAVTINNRSRCPNLSDLQHLGKHKTLSGKQMWINKLPEFMRDSRSIETPAQMSVISESFVGCYKSTWPEQQMHRYYLMAHRELCVCLGPLIFYITCPIAAACCRISAFLWRPRRAWYEFLWLWIISTTSFSPEWKK